MATTIAKKVSAANHGPGKDNDRFVVYSKQFNDLVDVVLQLEGSDGVLTADSMTIAGSASGTDALTLTAGDILITSGNFDMTVGDATLADGSLAITDADNATSFSVTNGTITTAVACDIVLAALTTGKGLSITADAVTTGDMLYLDNGGASMTGDGKFINCNDDDTSKFSVASDGAITIAGTAAGTAAATLTLGDLVISDGGLSVAAQSVTPNNDSGAASTIDNNAVAVDVGAVTTDVNDWIVLPSLSAVPVGHTIRIACNAGGNFELRTPASSGEKINTVNSDGTAEYLCVDTEVVVITKVSDTDGWAAYDIPALGGVGTATIPD